jgi:hypothetical protein
LNLCEIQTDRLVVTVRSSGTPSFKAVPFFIVWL